MEIDPQFRQSRAASRRRRLKRRMQLFAVGGSSILAVIGVVTLVIWLVNRPDTDPSTQAASDTDQIMQVETDTAVAAVRVATPFVDIPGDPMILRFDTGDGGKATRLAGSDALDVRRFGYAQPDRFALISEDLVVQESRLITALPSSREDFAFFQAQRSKSFETQPNLPALITTPDVATGQTQGEVVTVEGDDNSWGDAIGGGDDDLPLTYINTRIQNTTSVAFVRPEATRQKLSRDLVVRLEYPRSLADLLTSNDFDADTSQILDKAAQTLIPALAAITSENQLAAGTIVALRYRPRDDALVPLQISIYGADGHIGSLARRGAVGYVVSEDPWRDANLLQLASPNRGSGGQTQDYRLLDAVYSALIRNGVPTTLVGELIVLLSQSYDLESIAAPGDKITVLYAPEGGSGPGQVAFAGIAGPSGEMPCYVALKASAGAQDFGCFTRNGMRGGAGGSAFVTPVQGTLSSPYGPRFHPVLKEVRLHGGVDWAAPTGTPIVAAFAGRIAVAGNGGGYGNVVYIDHADGLQSRYAHMDRFAPGALVGSQVGAGDVIGYVGTTGRSTGPHLHFEIRKDGAPIDPFSLGGGGTLAASDAVEALTDQIIKVESAGNANAKNPLSTATGLGQFIESTWLRMMRTYRPDLASTMSQADLLELRKDPTLSREMVQNLARENESFLRARGHHVDAGRLYLAHFLGPAGASTVLGAEDAQTILEVMGAAVVRANPFLTEYTVADLEAWAARKMRGAGTSGPRRQPLSPEVRAYIEAIDAVLLEDA